MRVDQLLASIEELDMSHALTAVQLPGGKIYMIKSVELEDPGEDAVGPTVWLKVEEF